MSFHPQLLAIHRQLLERPVRKVYIALGELFPLTEEELRVQWSELANSKTELVIRLILAEHQCMACFEKYHPAQKEPSCPYCGSVGAKVIAGEEFYLESMEAEDE